MGCSKILLVNPTSEPARESLYESCKTIKISLKEQQDIYKKHNMGAEVKCITDIFSGISNRISEPIAPLNFEIHPAAAYVLNNESQNSKNETSPQEEKLSSQAFKNDLVGPLFNKTLKLKCAFENLIELKNKISPSQPADLPREIAVAAKNLVQIVASIKQEETQVANITGYSFIPVFSNKLGTFVKDFIGSIKQALVASDQPKTESNDLLSGPLKELIDAIVEQANIAQQYYLSTNELTLAGVAVKNICSQISEKETMFKGYSVLKDQLNWTSYRILRFMRHIRSYISSIRRYCHGKISTDSRYNTQDCYPRQKSQ